MICDISRIKHPIDQRIINRIHDSRKLIKSKKKCYWKLGGFDNDLIDKIEYNILFQGNTESSQFKEDRLSYNFNINTYNELSIRCKLWFNFLFNIKTFMTIDSKKKIELKNEYDKQLEIGLFQWNRPLHLYKIDLYKCLEYSIELMSYFFISSLDHPYEFLLETMFPIKMTAERIKEGRNRNRNMNKQQTK